MRLLGKLMKHEIQYNKMNYYFLFIYTRLGFKAETLDYFLSVKKNCFNNLLSVKTMSEKFYF